MAQTGLNTGRLVDFTQSSLFRAAYSIAIQPLFWNIVVRQEYRTRFLTRLFGGRPRLACYAFACVILSLGLLRDAVFKIALDHQPTWAPLQTVAARSVGVALVVIGNVLVLSSAWALGITGTFLGDYFGILMDHMVTGFPFNIMNAPMYYGSTMTFLGTALLYGRPAGVLLTFEVLLVYLVALRFENAFTREIYARRDRERATQPTSKKIL